MIEVASFGLFNGLGLSVDLVLVFVTRTISDEDNAYWVEGRWRLFSGGFKEREEEALGSHCQ